MESNITYNINWSGYTIVITLVVTAIIIFAVYKLLKNISIINAIIAGGLIFVQIFGLSQMPVSIKIENDKFVLNKFIGKKELNIKDIDSMGISDDDMGIRLFGSGGSFGFLGSFKNENIGEYTAYVLDTNNKFYIKLKNGKAYAFSCENPNQLLNNIEILKNKN